MRILPLSAMLDLDAPNAKSIAIVEALFLIPLLSALIGYVVALAGATGWPATAAGMVTGLILLRFYLNYIFSR